MWSRTLSGAGYSTKRRGADFGGDAPPEPGLRHYLQRVCRRLEHGGYPIARGELAATRKVGGRASLCVVGDGCPL